MFYKVLYIGLFLSLWFHPSFLPSLFLHEYSNRIHHQLPHREYFCLLVSWIFVQNVAQSIDHINCINFNNNWTLPQYHPLLPWRRNPIFLSHLKIGFLHGPVPTPSPPSAQAPTRVVSLSPNSPLSPPCSIDMHVYQLSHREFIFACKQRQNFSCSAPWIEVFCHCLKCKIRFSLWDLSTCTRHYWHGHSGGSMPTFQMWHVAINKTLSDTSTSTELIQTDLDRINLHAICMASNANYNWVCIQLLFSLLYILWHWNHGCSQL